MTVVGAATGLDTKLTVGQVEFWVQDWIRAMLVCTGLSADLTDR